MAQCKDPSETGRALRELSCPRVGDHQPADSVVAERSWDALYRARTGETEQSRADLEDAAFRFYLPMARSLSHSVCKESIPGSRPNRPRSWAWPTRCWRGDSAAAQDSGGSPVQRSCGTSAPVDSRCRLGARLHQAGKWRALFREGQSDLAGQSCPPTPASWKSSGKRRPICRVHRNVVTVSSSVHRRRALSSANGRIVAVFLGGDDHMSGLAPGPLERPELGFVRRPHHPRTTHRWPAMAPFSTAPTSTPVLAAVS